MGPGIVDHIPWLRARPRGLDPNRPGPLQVIHRQGVLRDLAAQGALTDLSRRRDPATSPVTAISRRPSRTTFGDRDSVQSEVAIILNTADG